MTRRTVTPAQARRAQIKRTKALKAKCSTGKRRYKTLEEADRALAEIRQREQRTKTPRRAFSCQRCGGFHLTSAQWDPARAPLPKASAKRAKEQRQRTKMLREMFPDRPVCAVDGCNQWADDPHEPRTRARGGSITDRDNIKPLCRRHHDIITFSPESELGWAYDAGLLVHSWEAS